MSEKTFFVCDGCEGVRSSPMNMITIEKIFVDRLNTYSVGGDGPIKREDIYTDLHFCCKKCLTNWIDKKFEENPLLGRKDVNHD